jgi:hypothetical protein
VSWEVARLDGLIDGRPPVADALERELGAHVVAYRAGDDGDALVQMCRVAEPASLSASELARLRAAEPPGIVLVAYAKPLRRSAGSLEPWRSAPHR